MSKCDCFFVSYPIITHRLEGCGKWIADWMRLQEYHLMMIVIYDDPQALSMPFPYSQLRSALRSHDFYLLSEKIIPSFLTRETLEWPFPSG